MGCARTQNHRCSALSLGVADLRYERAGRDLDPAFFFWPDAATVGIILLCALKECLYLFVLVGRFSFAFSLEPPEIVHLDI